MHSLNYHDFFCPFVCFVFRFFDLLTNPLYNAVLIGRTYKHTLCVNLVERIIGKHMSMNDGPCSLLHELKNIQSLVNGTMNRIYTNEVNLIIIMVFIYFCLFFLRLSACYSDRN